MVDFKKTLKGSVKIQAIQSDEKKGKPRDAVKRILRTLNRSMRKSPRHASLPFDAFSSEKSPSIVLEYDKNSASQDSPITAHDTVDRCTSNTPLRQNNVDRDRHGRDVSLSKSASNQVALETGHPERISATVNNNSDNGKGPGFLEVSSEERPRARLKSSYKHQSKHVGVDTWESVLAESLTTEADDAPAATAGETSKYMLTSKEINSMIDEWRGVDKPQMGQSKAKLNGSPSALETKAFEDGKDSIKLKSDSTSYQNPCKGNSIVRKSHNSLNDMPNAKAESMPSRKLEHKQVHKPNNNTDPGSSITYTFGDGSAGYFNQLSTQAPPDSSNYTTPGYEWASAKNGYDWGTRNQMYNGSSRMGDIYTQTMNQLRYQTEQNYETLQQIHKESQKVDVSAERGKIANAYWYTE